MKLWLKIVIGVVIILAVIAVLGKGGEKADYVPDTGETSSETDLSGLSETEQLQISIINLGNKINDLEAEDLEGLE